MGRKPIFNLEEMNLRVDGERPDPLSRPECYRARVPGGWLVFLWGAGTGATFFPDPDHEWDGGTLEPQWTSSNGDYA